MPADNSSKGLGLLRLFALNCMFPQDGIRERMEKTSHTQVSSKPEVSQPNIK